MLRLVLLKRIEKSENLMKSYKILSLSLISFLIIGCASRSRTVKLNDGRGNI